MTYRYVNMRSLTATSKIKLLFLDWTFVSSQ